MLTIFPRFFSRMIRAAFLRAEEGAGQVSLDDLVPDGKIRIGHGGRQQVHPDIVDEDIEAAESADGRIEEVLHIPLSGDMGRQRPEAARRRPVFPRRPQDSPPSGRR